MSYILNKDVKVRVGGRKIAKMSEQEFIDKVRDFCADYIQRDSSWYDTVPQDQDELLEFFVTAIASIGQSNRDSKIKRDFKGLEVDLENRELDSFRTTPGGCPYVVGYVGGDWENPVCFIAYHDGDEMRAYLPKSGNTWRTGGDTGKIALGNLDDDDVPETDEQWVIKDLIRSGQLPKGTTEVDISDIDYNVDLCINEFLSRVGETPQEVLARKVEDFGTLIMVLSTYLPYGLAVKVPDRPADDQVDILDGLRISGPVTIDKTVVTDFKFRTLQEEESKWNSVQKKQPKPILKRVYPADMNKPMKYLMSNKYDTGGFIDAGIAIDADNLDFNPYD